MIKLDKLYLLMAEKYTDNIIQYTSGVDTVEEFEQNNMMYDACAMNFINTPEALKNLSTKFREDYPEIPYHSIIALRNIAAHTYEGLNAARLFHIVKNELKELNGAIKEIIKKNHFA